ncbi:MAG: hypothetical protein KTR27_15230 [Leptolyngbyaceae cyanobacterium MAG.088]|nr:hypothetical protein [Leptolyngbyaceae cyanobacterium MAG.088]
MKTNTIFPEFDVLSRKLKSLTNTKVKAQKLIYFCGLKRSGLHAVSFWLLSHQANHAFINNSPLKQAGDGSPMVRTVQTSPLPVKVQVGDPVRICKDHHEQTMALPNAVNLLVVLFQSQHLWHLQTHEPPVSGVDAAEVQRILLLRDPFNWAASYMQKSQHPSDVDVWPDMWKEYAKEYLGITNHLPSKVTINYNQWFVDQFYRQTISKALGLEFTDRSLNVVTAHAGGSSFDKTNFNQNAQQMAVTQRWQSFKENDAYRQAFRKRLDIVELAEEIFELPPDLAEFAHSLKR